MSFEIHLRRCGGIALISVALASCGGSDNTAVTPVTATPTFSEAGGPFTTAQTVSITDTTSGAVIYYTLDGTTPATTVGGSTLQYSGPLTITNSTNIAAIALAPGHTASQATGASYTIGPAAAAAGIWVEDVNGAATVIGIVTASGHSIFINAIDYSQYAGAVTVTGTTFSAALDGFTNFPATFADNSTSGTGAFNATLGTDSSLVGAFTFESAGGHAYPATWTLSYATVSLSGSLVSALAGSYVDASSTADPNTGGTITISSAGVMASSGASSGCVMDGTISTADPTTNIYEVSYTYAGCTGAWVDLNGVGFSGLAVLNGSAGQLIMAANGQGGGAAQYGLVTALDFQ
jgi:Chitobiase/beta-hexosaminidase C-terminal domain